MNMSTCTPIYRIGSKRGTKRIDRRAMLIGNFFLKKDGIIINFEEAAQKKEFKLIFEHKRASSEKIIVEK
ncbi:unnamed protein product [Rhizophagus irregularis]|nr:unnamed protein product [Rhizophagus irregularis]CAB5296817.1 unnamed protein product [Rhizophagus irregularis]